MTVNLSGQPEGPSRQQEVGETHKPHTINIFAINDKFTQTTEDHVSAQGFGYSSPLETPVEHNDTRYWWEGQLHNNLLNPDGQSSNSNDSLTALAQNFADQYRSHLDLALQKLGLASYSLQFQPTEKQIEAMMKNANQGVTRIVRGLSPEEQTRFMDAFQNANKNAAKNK